VVRDVLPQLRSLANPTLKFILHASIRAGEQSREIMAQWTEFFQDTLAEVRHDLRERQRAGRGKATSKKTKQKKKAKVSASEMQPNVINLTERRTHT
jgi:hypothetical protein